MLSTLGKLSAIFTKFKKLSSANSFSFVESKIIAWERVETMSSAVKELETRWLPCLKDYLKYEWKVTFFSRWQNYIFEFKVFADSKLNVAQNSQFLFNPFACDMTKLKEFADDTLNVNRITNSLFRKCFPTVTSIFSVSHCVFQSILP